MIDRKGREKETREEKNGGINEIIARVLHNSMVHSRSAIGATASWADIIEPIVGSCAVNPGALVHIVALNVRPESGGLEPSKAEMI